MAENKTKQTDASVEAFLAAIPDSQKREDSATLIDIMQGVTGHLPKMWGPSIIGFGSHHYVYESGREGDTPIAAFSPRKAAISLYINARSAVDEIDPLLESLGKYTMGKGCLYIKRLADVDERVLRQIIQTSVESYKERS